jgi:hypothetical protein
MSITFHRKPLTITAVQGTSITAIEEFVAPGYFDLDDPEDGDLPHVLAYPHSVWTEVGPTDWVIRYGEGMYDVVEDEEFQRDYEVSR